MKMNKNVNTSENRDIRDLRNKNLGPEKTPEFKTTLMKGYQIKQVNEYLINLKIQHDRTVETYKERIDEFTTFTEMLNKEKEEFRLKAETLERTCDDYTKKIWDLEEQLSHSAKKQPAKAGLEDALEDALEKNSVLSMEKSLLEKELHEIALSHNELAGESAVIKSQWEQTKETLEKCKKENLKQLEFDAHHRAKIRKADRDLHLMTAEFKEKQSHFIHQSADSLQTVLTYLEELKKGMDDLTGSIENTDLSCESQLGSE
jgi:chromosome segregation ATPase